ncbi:hypothetical protein GNZ12_41275 [Paraburkholderia sp. 1N]|uniref:Transposase n=1 Tax=Paraburkholderia solitsugae TaxID=2675748 RepID=A0ABX2C3L9_9BURK|nr:hypothetical protein [Paraburkholderia solitsugae]NPT47616.1 hypothetical protein [Paraburkholderia solitsugae]
MNNAAFNDTLAALREALGEEGVRMGAEIGERSMTDWTKHAATWPPPRGWKRSTIGRAMTAEQRAIFEQRIYKDEAPPT